MSRFLPRKKMALSILLFLAIGAAQADVSLTGEMVTIPAGTFQMGSTNGNSPERPVRTVNVSSFRMGKYEVTFAQWDDCVSDGGCAHRPSDSGWGRGDRPVMNVNYNDVTQQFIPWLNKKTGQTFRLPSEAEWEYAARAGTTTEYPWGNTANHDYANFGDGRNGRTSGRDQWLYTAPVGSFPANEFGLHDMHGNVWEWVQDCANSDYNGAPTDGSAWMQGNCQSAIRRGGSWQNEPSGLRSAVRSFVGRSQGRSYTTIGFRLAQDASSTDAQPTNYDLSISNSGAGQGTITSNPSGINCGNSCSASFANNQTVTINAVAASGSTFASWSGACSGTGSSCTVTMSQARNVAATFNPAVRTLSISKSGTGQGSITSNPSGINCGSSCTVNFNNNQVATLTAVAASGSTFAGWSGACSGTGSSCSITMSQARSVTAVFNRIPIVHTLSVSKQGSGEGAITSNPPGIDCGNSCTSNINEGQLVTLTAVAADGSTFAGWSGACSGASSCSVSMDQAQSVTATFNSNQSEGSVSIQGIEMVTIPAGSFQMGRASGGLDRERPVRTVNVPSFRIGKFEVTFAQWDACVSDGGCSYNPSDAGWGRGDRPVMNVNYNDITQQFIPWLNEKTGQTFRLPSEAEWEYAARAGTTSDYHWGDTFSHEYANYGDGRNGVANGRDQWINTSPVGSFPANSFGLHDMHGNVWEWVQDCVNGNYNGAPVNGSAWMQGNCFQGVRRGGSWQNDGGGVSFRSFTGRGSRYTTLGFRLAQDISSTGAQPTNRSLIINKSGTGQGTITSNPSGINCGSSCTASFTDNQTVTLSAVAASGYKFVGWSGSCANSAGTCQLSMDRAHSVTASFERDDGRAYFGPNISIFYAEESILHIPNIEVNGEQLWVDLYLLPGDRLQIRGAGPARSEQPIYPATVDLATNRVHIPYASIIANNQVEAERYALDLQLLPSGNELSITSLEEHVLTFLSLEGSQDGEVRAVMMNQKGEKIMLLGDNDASGNVSDLQAVGFEDTDGNVMTVFIEESGLPGGLVVDDYVFAFSNYTDTSVDIEITSPDGNTQIIENAQLNAALLAELSPSGSLNISDLRTPYFSALSAGDAIGGFSGTHEFGDGAKRAKKAASGLVSLISCLSTKSSAASYLVSLISETAAQVMKNACNSAGMAVGELLTNLLSAGIDVITLPDKIKNGQCTVDGYMLNCGDFSIDVKNEQLYQHKYKAETAGVSVRGVDSPNYNKSGSNFNWRSLVVQENGSIKTLYNGVNRSNTWLVDRNLAGYSAMITLIANRNYYPSKQVAHETLKKINPRDLSGRGNNILYSAQGGVIPKPNNPFQQSGFLVNDLNIAIAVQDYGRDDLPSDAPNRDVIFLSFEGSHSNFDWVRNVLIEPANFYGTAVHGGFNSAVRFVIDDVLPDPDTEFYARGLSRDVTLEQYFQGAARGDHHPVIVLSGHSLGGAIATLLGAYLIEIGVNPEDILVQTYGSPAVGRRNFVSKYTGSLNVRNFVNNNDPVPFASRLCGNYRPIGSNYAFTAALESPSFDFSELSTCSAFTDEVGLDTDSSSLKLLRYMSGANSAHNLFDAYLKQFDEAHQSFKWADVESLKALTVTKGGAGEGEIASNPAGIACGNSCSASYTSGQLITLTAKAASGSTFAGWGGACSGTGSCTVTMSQARNVTATFNTSQSGNTVTIEGIEMLTIPGGSFQMGSFRRSDNARPVRTVNVPSFRMGKYEVTFEQWDACVSDGGCSYSPSDSGWGRGNRPVINVSYNDITQQFVPWLNSKTGQAYRLPTEAEWEYAARAGTTSDFHWGIEPSSDYENFSGTVGRDVWAFTAPVGSFLANPFGLHDMHGNVKEWVQDCWNESYSNAPTDGSAWMLGDCSLAVRRGGSFLENTIVNPVPWVNSASRAARERTNGYSNVGFRLAQDI